MEVSHFFGEKNSLSQHVNNEPEKLSQASLALIIKLGSQKTSSPNKYI